MKLKVFYLLACLLSAGFVFSQAPSVPYQAVARDASGNLLVNQLIALRLTIHDVTAIGTTLYQERDTVTTNKLGLFTVNIGTGAVLAGSFSGINWSTNAKYLQIDLDPSGGTGYTFMGTSQMESVPYALYSVKAGSVPSGNLTETTSGVLTITGGTGAVVGSGTTIQVAQATNSTSGYLASTDWTSFNNKITGTGTQYYVPYYSVSGTPGTLSVDTKGIYDDGNGDIGIGSAALNTHALQVDGTGRTSGGSMKVTAPAASGTWGLWVSNTGIQTFQGYTGTFTDALGQTITNPGIYQTGSSGTATPYYASFATTSAVLDVFNSLGNGGTFVSGSASYYGILGDNISATGAGLAGINSAASSTGTGIGVYGSTAQSSGEGMLGLNSNAAGVGIAGINTAASASGTGIGVSGTTAQSGGYGVYAANSNAAGSALLGSNTVASGTGTGSGVIGTTNQSAGFGIEGLHTNAAGVAVLGLNSGAAGNGGGIGVYGSTAQSAGAGVYGKNTNAAGTGLAGANTAAAGGSTGTGVQGTTSQTSGYGVYGTNTSANGVAVFGNATAATVTDSVGVGVYGLTNQAGNVTFGAFTLASSTYGAGVLGKTTNGNGAGVIGINTYTTTETLGGVGVYGFSQQTNGGAGVFGEDNNIGGNGLKGVNSAINLGGVGNGVYGQTNQGNGYGVEGENMVGGGVGVAGLCAAASGTNNGNGVYGNTLQSGGAGVWGYNNTTKANGFGPGVVGIGGLSQTVTLPAGGIGGAFYATATSGTEYGVYAIASGAATTNIGGYFTATGATTNIALDVAGAFILGNNGTGLTAAIKASGVTPGTAYPSIAANGSQSEVYTVANAATTGVVHVSPTSAMTAGLFIEYAYVSAAGAVTVSIGNHSGAAITPGSVSLNITVIQ